MSFDSPEANARFAEKEDFPFLLLSDQSREMGLAYGACDSKDASSAKRIAYLIDEEGNVAEAHEKIDVSSYPEEQLESI